MKFMTRKGIEKKYYLKSCLGNVTFPMKKNVDACSQSHPVSVMVDTDLKTMK